jgi:Na+/H+-translocating membrane pyrophosphatase
LKKQLIYSTVLLIPLIWIAASFAFGDFVFIDNAGIQSPKTTFDIFSCIIFGLVAGLIIGYVTEIMTSYSYAPVK